MIPLAIPNLSGNEEKYLIECIRTNFVSSVGPFVDRFENMVAARSQSSLGVSTSSGTTAIQLALTTLGVQRDDLVITPSFTFIATANAISHTGATPWLIDVSPESWTLCPQKLEEALSAEAVFASGKLVHKKSGRRISCILPVYTLGLCADMDPICAIAKKYDLPVVADAAAALGATYKGKEIGGLATLSTLSFNGNKTITTGSGGMVIGNDKDLLARAKHLATTARVGADYVHDAVGFNFRMCNIEAALGCAQMEQFDFFLERKRQIDRNYREGFRSLGGVEMFPSPTWSQSACWFPGVLLNSEMDTRVVCQKLVAEGVAARTFWRPTHLQAPYAEAPRTDMNVSDRIWSQILTLPCSTGMTSDEQNFVIDRVKFVLKELS
ncbi:MAG: pyridoxal-5'-phosphate-dependent protein [Bdellovibrio sp. CG10_big_fil_rev_8_21_14_0_10_47_8]|nr:MAG: pyridoxal-5'-phosphate-dependent protein [Bdellovibrio sp. CG10_big_fil_rev_8_21_14_0_10_47_8]